MRTYVANMLGFFERLELGEAVTEEAKLTLIKKNLHPAYLQKLALTPIRSIRELKDYGKHPEVTMARVESYDARGARNKVLETEFACPKGNRPPRVLAYEEKPAAEVMAFFEIR